MIITLPWPDKALFQNESQRKGGHYPRMEAAKDYRQYAFLETLRTVAKYRVEKDLEIGKIVSIGLDFYPPNNRRDFLNMPGAMKPGFDGIFEYLGQNDKNVTEGYFKVHPADKVNPRVVISLIEKE